MKAMFDFACEQCDSIIERYIDTKTQHIACECGGTAHRLISTPTVKLEGISGDFPGAHARWAKIREDNAKIKAKRDS